MPSNRSDEPDLETSKLSQHVPAMLSLGSNILKPDLTITIPSSPVQSTTASTQITSQPRVVLQKLSEDVVSSAARDSINVSRDTDLSDLFLSAASQFIRAYTSSRKS